VEHSQATAVASASTNQLAMIPYDPTSLLPVPVATPGELLRDCRVKVKRVDDPLECIKGGDLEALKHAVQVSMPEVSFVML
jgi:hypothetical protein